MFNQDTLLGFLVGVIITMLGALFNNQLTIKREKQRIYKVRLFDIYMKMLELYGYYFWISSAEMQKKKPDEKIKYKCRELAWKIADLLRHIDDFKLLEEILIITHSHKYDNASERYRSMGDLINQLGKMINPKYLQVIKNINSYNENNLENNISLNAPARF